MVDYYKQIFKRKSFHFFKDRLDLKDDELNKLNNFIKNIKPLDKDIKTLIKIVKEEETSCKRGGEYCLLFYSEKSGNYLRNIGYIGEQIDLYLASQNIGALWYGIGKPKDMVVDGLNFVIMISFAKMNEDRFRKDMFKSKRKKLEETWFGDTLGVGEIVRFTPSACNTQPWICENTGDELIIYRYKKPGKRGIMPAEKVRFYNKIDMGIYLFMLEICLENEGYKFDRFIYEDNTCDEIEKTLIAKYVISK